MHFGWNTIWTPGWQTLTSSNESVWLLKSEQTFGARSIPGVDLFCFEPGSHVAKDLEFWPSCFYLLSAGITRKCHCHVPLWCFKQNVPHKSWWLFGIIRCGLAGGSYATGSQLWGFKGLMTFQVSSQLPVCGWRRELSATSVTCCLLPHGLLSFWHRMPQVNPFFHKLSLSWYSVTVIEKYLREPSCLFCCCCFILCAFFFFWC